MLRVAILLVLSSFAWTHATNLLQHPPVGQQVTWMYGNDLAKSAAFVAALGFVEVNGTLQRHSCRIFHAAPSQYIGVCDTRPAPRCPHGPEGALAPPVTFTLVVESVELVRQWHAHLVAVGSDVVQITAPSKSTRFGCYAFNFYDVDQTHGLGCYRFEVQAFLDPAWPSPQCHPVVDGFTELPDSYHSVAAAQSTRPIGWSTPASLPTPTPTPMPTPTPTPTPPAARRVQIDLFLSSLSPDAPRCERLLAPMLETVGELVDVRLSYLGDLADPTPSATPSATALTCAKGPRDCIGNRAQLCTHRHWPPTVNVEVRGLPRHLNWWLFLRCAGEDASGSPFNGTREALIPQNTNACLQRHAVPSATADAIGSCVRGSEGTALLRAAISRTHSHCGAACQSCTIHIDGQPACVLNGGSLQV